MQVCKNYKTSATPDRTERCRHATVQQESATTTVGCAKRLSIVQKVTVCVCQSVQSLSVQESDGLGEETVPQFGSEGQDALVPLSRRQQVKSVCEGCVGSSTMLVALRMQWVLYVSVVFSAVLTITLYGIAI